METISDSAGLGIILFIIWWLAAAVAIKSAAKARGYTGSTWFWASIVLGPFLAVLLLIAYPQRDEDRGAGGDGMSILTRT